jgi:hypothetical protein
MIISHLRLLGKLIKKVGIMTTQTIRTTMTKIIAAYRRSFIELYNRDNKL